MAEPEVLHPLRPFLKNWVWEHGHVGTRYLDCSDGQVKFDDGKKARFAAEGIFYVPLGADTDVAAGATAPAIHEGALARFLRAAQLGKPDEGGSVADIQRAAQDCVDLVLVCAYQQEAQRALATYALEPMFEDEICAAVIHDIRSRYVGLRTQLELYDFTVFSWAAVAAADQRGAVHRLARARASSATVRIAAARAILHSGGYALPARRVGRALCSGRPSAPWGHSRITTDTLWKLHACGSLRRRTTSSWPSRNASPRQRATSRRPATPDRRRRDVKS